MKGGAHPSPFAALAFPNSKKVPIFCWVDRESFPVKNHSNRPIIVGQGRPVLAAGMGWKLFEFWGHFFLSFNRVLPGTETAKVFFVYVCVLGIFLQHKM